MFHDDFVRDRTSGLTAPRPTLQADFLKRLGYDVHLVCWIKKETSCPEREVINDATVHRVVCLVPPDSFVGKAKAMTRVQKLMHRVVTGIKPDGIICHNPEVLRGAVRAKKRLGVPLFYDSHEDWPAMVAEENPRMGSWFLKLEKKLIKNVDHTFTVGPGIAKKFQAWGVPVTVIHNSRSMHGVPQRGSEEACALRRSLGYQEGDFILGFVGNLTPESKIDMLIKLLPALPDNIKLLLAGGREDVVREYSEMAKSLKLQNRVHITGRLSSHQMMTHVACFDLGSAILELASDNYLHRCPHKIFEYMAVGIPQLISDFPDMKSIVVDDAECGVALDPEDEDGIQETIRALSENQEWCRNMGQKGRKAFEKKYCWERMEERYALVHPFFVKK